MCRKPTLQANLQPYFSTKAASKHTLSRHVAMIRLISPNNRVKVGFRDPHPQLNSAASSASLEYTKTGRPSPKGSGNAATGVTPPPAEDPVIVPGAGKPCMLPVPPVMVHKYYGSSSTGGNGSLETGNEVLFVVHV